MVWASSLHGAAFALAAAGIARASSPALCPTNFEMEGQRVALSLTSYDPTWFAAANEGSMYHISKSLKDSNDFSLIKVAMSLIVDFLGTYKTNVYVLAPGETDGTYKSEVTDHYCSPNTGHRATINL